jgi:L-amino acid N-acyltransferase YncA
MEINIKGIVELDKLNMSQIISHSGESFSPENRENDLIKDISDGVKFVEYNKYDNLVGYIQYEFLENGSCFIISLQIHPLYRTGVVLNYLLKSFARNLNKEKPKELTSFVHKGNPNSILLHNRLLFEIDKETELGFCFIHKKDSLQKLIDRFYIAGF